MKTIRPNIFEVTHAELGNPSDKGVVALPDGPLKGGMLHLNDADTRYILDHQAKGYEPIFFISRSEVMGGDYVVVARQQKA